MAILLVLWVMAGHSGYTYAVQSVIGDHDFIKEHRGLALEERFAAKLGTRYTYFRKVKESTPENAVIWLPSQNAFFKEAYADKFHSPHCSYRKTSALRFLWPRKVVLQKEYDSVLAEKFPLTHVVVVSGEGASLLPYPIPDTTFGVFPIERE